VLATSMAVVAPQAGVVCCQLERASPLIKAIQQTLIQINGMPKPGIIAMVAGVRGVVAGKRPRRIALVSSGTGRRTLVRVTRKAAVTGIRM